MESQLVLLSQQRHSARGCMELPWPHQLLEVAQTLLKTLPKAGGFEYIYIAPSITGKLQLLELHCPAAVLKYGKADWANLVAYSIGTTAAWLNALAVEQGYQCRYIYYQPQKVESSTLHLTLELYKCK